MSEKQYQEEEFLRELEFQSYGVDYDNEPHLRKGFQAGWDAAMEAVRREIRKAA